ncbi:hypothetical protein GX586_01995, partial [bacterium]|nr:hypothetical protein [bacterium]
MKTHGTASCVAAILICGVLSAADEWYTFTPKNTPDAGEIGMRDWIEKPAGKHGRIARKGELLMYNG